MTSTQPYEPQKNKNTWVFLWSTRNEEKQLKRGCTCNFLATSLTLIDSKSSICQTSCLFRRLSWPQEITKVLLAHLRASVFFMAVFINGTCLIAVPCQLPCLLVFFVFYKFTINIWSLPWQHGQSEMLFLCQDMQTQNNRTATEFCPHFVSILRLCSFNSGTRVCLNAGFTCCSYLLALENYCTQENISPYCTNENIAGLQCKIIKLSAEF